MRAYVGKIRDDPGVFFLDGHIQVIFRQSKNDCAAFVFRRSDAIEYIYTVLHFFTGILQSRSILTAGVGVAVV